MVFYLHGRLSLVFKSRFLHISPRDYDSAAVLVREVGDQVVRRLELVALSPKRILEVGSAAGYCTRLLQKPTFRLSADSRI